MAPGSAGRAPDVAKHGSAFTNLVLVLAGAVEGVPIAVAPSLGFSWASQCVPGVLIAAGASDAPTGQSLCLLFVGIWSDRPSDATLPSCPDVPFPRTVEGLSVDTATGCHFVLLRFLQPKRSVSRKVCFPAVKINTVTSRGCGVRGELCYSSGFGWRSRFVLPGS